MNSEMYSVGWWGAETMGRAGGLLYYPYFYEFWVVYRIRQSVSDKGH